MAQQKVHWRVISHLAAALTGGVVTYALIGQSEPRSADADNATGPVLANQSEPSSIPKMPTISASPPPVDRAELLAAAALAADSVASAAPPPPDNVALVGRSFVVRLPFGCGGPDGDMGEAGTGWTFNPTTRALRLFVQSTDIADVGWVKDLANGMTFDAAEGFWIRRPWTREDRCISTQTAAGAVTSPASEQTLAIVQFFSPDGSRTLRRGSRPYAATIKLPKEATPSTRGYQIQLEGRIAAFADGQPVRCVQTDPSRQPRCAVTVEFERIALIEPGRDDPLTEWR